MKKRLSDEDRADTSLMLGHLVWYAGTFALLGAVVLLIWIGSLVG